MTAETIHGFENMSQVMERMSLKFEFGEKDMEDQIPLVVGKPHLLVGFFKTSKEIFEDITKPQENRSRNAWFDAW